MKQLQKIIGIAVFGCLFGSLASFARDVEETGSVQFPESGESIADTCKPTKVHYKDANRLNEMIVESICAFQDTMRAFYAERNIEINDWYAVTDGLPPDFPSKQIPNTVFFSMRNSKGLPTTIRRVLKRGIKAFFIQGIELTDNRIIITIGLHSIELEKRYEMFKIGVSDWLISTYAFQLGTQEWLLTNRRWTGI